MLRTSYILLVSVQGIVWFSSYNRSFFTGIIYSWFTTNNVLVWRHRLKLATKTDSKPKLLVCDSIYGMNPLKNRREQIKKKKKRIEFGNL